MCFNEKKKLIEFLIILFQFITIRQFPPADKSLPPLNKSRWWIPTGKLKKDFCPKKISLLHPNCRSNITPIKNFFLPISTATKVMALLNAANNLGPNIVEYTDFYNVSLDHMDLMSEYYTWQNPDRPGQFSYCQVIS